MSECPGRNYTAHGGRETVIGGRLTFLPGAEIVGLDKLLPMSEGVKLNAMPDSDATTVAQLRGDFNALLGALRASGVMAVGDET